MSKELKHIKLLGELPNLFNDNIAFLQQWDFSRANRDDESRIEAITKVASVCYDNPNAVGKKSLYDRLAAEAGGLPSSSFEFIPVLIPYPEFVKMMEDMSQMGVPFVPHILKYGEWVVDVEEEGDSWYLVTNYRALYYDNEHFSTTKDFLNFYNTEEECNLLKEYVTTFLCKMDIATSKQHNRHRISLQELSRRYVSGKKTPFEFYAPEELAIVSEHADDESEVFYDQDQYLKVATQRYFQLLDKGVKPQSARRVLPQSMYTTVWSSFMPSQLKNYLNLRDDLHAQQEIRWIAQGIKQLMKD